MNAVGLHKNWMLPVQWNCKLEESLSVRKFILQIPISLLILRSQCQCWCLNSLYYDVVCSKHNVSIILSCQVYFQINSMLNAIVHTGKVCQTILSLFIWCKFQYVYLSRNLMDVDVSLYTRNPKAYHYTKKTCHFLAWNV